MWLTLFLLPCLSVVLFQQCGGFPFSDMQIFPASILSRSVSLMQSKIAVSCRGKMAAKIKEEVNILGSGVVHFCGWLDIWLSGG